MVGGYKIVNFNNVNLLTTNADGTIIKGVYESIENSYRKPILFSGVVVDGVEKNAFYAEITTTENSFAISAYGKTITITNDDKVVIA